MKAWMIAFALLFAPALASANSDEFQNITMLPANPATDSDVTICFDARNTAGQNIRFALGFADAGYTFNCNTTNQINWVVDDRGVYRGGSLSISGTATATTSVNYTDVIGPASGINAGTTAGTQWKQICVQTHVPPEFSGNYRLVILGSRDNIGFYSTSCAGCQNGNNYGYLDFTVSGTALRKLDLQACRYGAGVGAYTPGSIAYEYRVINNGESGVRITAMDIRFCFYDSQSCWEAQGSSAAQMYYPGTSTYCNTYNPASQFSFEEFPTVDCGADGKANHCYKYTLGGGPISQSMPYFVPPNGGFLESTSPPVFFRPCGWSGTSTNDPTDDYSNFMSWPQCDGPPSTQWTSSPKIGLYYGSQPVCEWDSHEEGDPNSGVPYCGSTSGCNNCPIAGQVSNLAKNPSGSSSVACLSIYSPTPTPVMQLTKVADKAQATIGDTITYTISWANNASSAQTMIIWDTVPSYVTYVGCNNGCTVSGGVVRWNLGSKAAGSSGSVQFWAVVSSYPALPTAPDTLQALAPRSKELWLSLWDPFSKGAPAAQ